MATKKSKTQKKATAKKASPKAKKAPAKKKVMPQKAAEKSPAKKAKASKAVEKPKQEEAPKKKPVARSFSVKGASMFQRSAGRMDAEGNPQPEGIDRSRLGAMQAKLFRDANLKFEDRQELAHMISDISMAANKQRIQRQQILKDLTKLTKLIKSLIKKASVRTEMLDDAEAFKNVVRKK
jgi:outer membrane biosynthesis protein TonB